MTDIQEMEIRNESMSKQKRIIHFSSGEMLEAGDSEEEEEEEQQQQQQQSSNRPPFSELTKRVGHCFNDKRIRVRCQVVLSALCSFFLG